MTMLAWQSAQAREHAASTGAIVQQTGLAATLPPQCGRAAIYVGTFNDGPSIESPDHACLLCRETYRNSRELPRFAMRFAMRYAMRGKFDQRLRALAWTASRQLIYNGPPEAYQVSICKQKPNLFTAKPRLSDVATASVAPFNSSPAASRAGWRIAIATAAGAQRARR